MQQKISLQELKLSELSCRSPNVEMGEMSERGIERVVVRAERSEILCSRLKGLGDDRGGVKDDAMKKRKGV